MAKTIKFNLICDDHSVRTLDDLREHFCIEDVLGYYKTAFSKDGFKSAALPVNLRL